MEYYKPRPEQPAPIQPTHPAPSNSVPSTPVAPTAAPVAIATPPVVASQPVKRPDGQRDYKYTQEISQMVRASSFSAIPHAKPGQMFVFGEIQDPNHETVNLVEDIVRGQLIELVRDPSCHHHIRSGFLFRSSRPAHSPTAEAPDTSLPKTSSSSSDTTEVKSTVSVHTSHGKTSENTPRTAVATAVEGSKSKP